MARPSHAKAIPRSLRRLPMTVMIAMDKSSTEVDHLPMSNTTSIDSWLGLHRQATEAVQPVYRQIRRADLRRMTPCAGWDLQQLLRHMVGQDHGFAAAVRAD